MKLGFITCVQLGLSCMEAIYSSGGTLELVVTLPDDVAVNKAGRVYLDEFCTFNDVQLLKSQNVNNIEVLEAVERADIDWLFIIGWSQIAKPHLLKAPNYGVLGIHPTLLPQGRGRAAIPWAILKRLPKTGVTLFKLDEGVDTGPIAKQLEIPLTERTTAGELYQKVNMAHIDLIQSVIPKIMSGELVLKEQDDRIASTWPGRKPEDGEISLDGSVWEAECLIRAVTKPYPGAFFVRNGFKFIVWSAEVLASKPRGQYLKFYDGFLKLVEFDRFPVETG